MLLNFYQNNYTQIIRRRVFQRNSKFVRNINQPRVYFYLHSMIRIPNLHWIEEQFHPQHPLSRSSFVKESQRKEADSALEADVSPAITFARGIGHISPPRLMSVRR